MRKRKLLYVMHVHITELYYTIISNYVNASETFYSSLHDIKHIVFHMFIKFQTHNFFYCSISRCVNMFVIRKCHSEKYNSLVIPNFQIVNKWMWIPALFKAPSPNWLYLINTRFYTYINNMIRRIVLYLPKMCKQT